MNRPKGEPDTNSGLIDLNDAGARIVSALRGKIDAGIEIGFAPAADPAMVQADPVEMEQIFADLADGAAHALTGGDRLQVEISRALVADPFAELCLDVPAGKYVVLSLKDTGRGMNSAGADPAAHPLIAKNRGAVLVHRTPGVGSLIRVLFAEAVPVEIRTPVSEPVALVSGTETILLVEDEIHIRQFLRRLLSRQGYEVLDAANGDDAILLASRYHGPIQLLLTDTVLPGQTGPEIAGSIVALRPGIAVLHMSGHGGSGEDFIQKPFPPSALLTRIRALLDPCRSSQAAD